MAVKHTFRYLKSTSGGVDEITETRATAIKFHCLDCSGGVYTEVKRCVIETCPLFPFRPYQDEPMDKRKMNLTDEQRKAIGERLQKVRKKKASA